MISADNIIFVSGCGHSGTTLMAAILDSHPKIYTIKRETNWFNNYKNTDNIINQEYAFEKNKEETRFYGKEILLEKTCTHVHSIPIINKKFPNSKHILVIRNPLDVCASLYERFLDIDRAIDRRNISNEFILTHISSDNCHLVRYELLVTAPKKELAEVCAFLNMEYSDDLLNFYTRDIQFEYSEVKQRNTQIKNPISNFNGKYKHIFSKQQTDYVLNNTHKIGKIFGYNV